MLSPKKGLLHPKFKAVEVDDGDGEGKEHTVVIDPENFYEGRYVGGNFKYRDGLKGGPVLLSKSQASPGRNFSQPRPPLWSISA